MALVKFRTLHTSFWDDTKITEDFTPEERYFFIYLLTNDKTSIAGCYEITVRMMAYETGIDRDKIVSMLNRLESAHNVIRYCDDTSELLILNWGRYNWSKSQKLIKAVENYARNIKFHAFSEYVLKRLEEHVEAISDEMSENEKYGMDTVSANEKYPMDTLSSTEKPITNTNTITNTNSNSISDAENEDSPSRGAMLRAALLDGICPQCKRNSMCQRPSPDGGLVWECYHGCDVAWVNGGAS